MKRKISMPLVAASSFFTGLGMAYISLVNPIEQPVFIIIGTAIAAVPMVEAVVLTAFRKCGYPF